MVPRSSSISAMAENITKELLIELNCRWDSISDYLNNGHMLTPLDPDREFDRMLKNLIKTRKIWLIDMEVAIPYLCHGACMDGDQYMLIEERDGDQHPTTFKYVSENDIDPEIAKNFDDLERLTQRRYNQMKAVDLNNPFDQQLLQMIKDGKVFVDFMKAEYLARYMDGYLIGGPR